MLYLGHGISPATMDRVPEGCLPGVVSVADGADLLVVFLAELNLLEVRDDARLLDTLRDDRVSAVCTPCNQNLGGGGAELFRDLLHDWVLGQLVFTDHWRDAWVRHARRGKRKEY